MRIRVLDRILVALAGLVLVAACAGIVGQVFFGLDIVGFLTKWFSTETTLHRVITASCAAVLLILGLYCVMVLFRHRRRKDKFVLQKLETGDLAISLDTLKTMVEKCVDQHPEIQPEGIKLENQRDGLLVRIRGTISGGISIPLTVDTLQKQIKQYVTACSGVEVKGIRIQIESSGEDAKGAVFAIDPPVCNLLPKGSEAPEEESISTPEAEEPEEMPAEKEPEANTEAENLSAGEAAAAAALAAAESMMSEMETEDDRPIHQRLFSTQEEPCIMPLPPENVASENIESWYTENDKPEETAPEEAATPEEETMPEEKTTPEEETVQEEETGYGAADEYPTENTSGSKEQEKGEDNA